MDASCGLDLLRRSLMPGDEVLHAFWQGMVLPAAAPPHFAGDFRRDVPRPALGKIETDHANRADVLALDHVNHHGLEISMIERRLAADPPPFSKIVDDEIGRSVALVRNNGR